MAGRASLPGDDHSLSDDEQRAWDNLTREIGPLTNLGNPRDYQVEDNEDDDAFVPPDPDLPPTPMHVKVPWMVLIIAIGLIVLVGFQGWPWYWGFAAFIGAAWAIITLLRQLPHERGNREPRV
ncbi:hypothetical protein SAMN02910418_00380 [Bowdeniella nasicola]|uniref:Uncharacterized protein n=1 Tax=Bowdeniella nasicola TaxID=208480 RepID=A0A1H3WEK8_9ACTO|nr:hypothetical protein [Bowdeniella nasicola]SDZ84688.1 hypothetical protein SAMN02910418_00380 [Bowdeniella nasicola]